MDTVNKALTKVYHQILEEDAEYNKLALAQQEIGKLQDRLDSIPPMMGEADVKALTDGKHIFFQVNEQRYPLTKDGIDAFYQNNERLIAQLRLAGIDFSTLYRLVVHEQALDEMLPCDDYITLHDIPDAGLVTQ